MLDDDQFKELSEFRQNVMSIWDYLAWAIVPVVVGLGGYQLMLWAWRIVRYVVPTQVR